MNIYIISCVILLCLLLLLIKLITWSMDNNNSAALKIFVSLGAVFSALLLFIIPTTLDGKYKADKLYNNYVELLSRINNSDDLTDIEKLQLNMEIDDYNWKLNFNESRLNDFFSSMGNLYEFDYIKIKV